MRKLKPWGLLLFAFFLCGMGVTGCGEGGRDREYYETTSESRRLFAPDNRETLLGMQYFLGEPVQLRADREDNVFMVKEDGAREQLAEGLKDAASLKCYLDGERNLYWWSRAWSTLVESEDAPGLTLHKLSPEGKELWSTELDPGALLHDICQLPDGRIVLLLRNPGGGRRVAEADSETGVLGRMDTVVAGQGEDDCIAAGKEGLLMMDSRMESFSEILPADGSRISSLFFGGGVYSIWTDKEKMELTDFRITEDGEVDMLWADMKSGLGTEEHLSFTKIEKIPVILRATLFYDEFLKQKIAQFNQENEKYHVILEYSNGYQDEMGERTAIEMATGEGPDILYGYILEYIMGIVEKGGLEDLRSYMDADGIKEEDYFPFAFLRGQDNGEIYGVRMKANVGYICVSEAVLGGREEPDINTLVNALLAWEGDAAIGGQTPSTSLLCYILLKGTNDYWGMVDWKKGTCDFGGELFAGMLKVAKRYGYTWEDIIAERYRDVPSLTQGVKCNLSGYKSPRDLEEMGTVMANIFEDGCHPSTEDYGQVFTVNANSSRKEGAWEFLRFIMSEEVQTEYVSDDFGVWGNPVTNRKAFLTSVQNMRTLLKEDPRYVTAVLGEKVTVPNFDTGEMVEMEFYYGWEDITEEWVREVVALLDDTRDVSYSFLSRSSVDRIISEEAEYYFTGEKSLEEVVEIINNRVGLYLEENR